MTDIPASSLSKADVQAAIDDVIPGNGDRVILPSGHGPTVDAGWSTPLTITKSDFEIVGNEFMASPDDYTDAIETIKTLAEAVYDATVAGSGRAAAWSAFTDARDDFQPTTTGLRFVIDEGADDVILSRMGLNELTISGVDWTVFWIRYETNDNTAINIESSHLGSGLFAQSIVMGALFRVSARTSDAGATDAFWNSIPITPAGFDMPWIQDVIQLSHDDPAQEAHSIDATWHGGKFGARRVVFSGGTSGRANVRFHGPYNIGGGCSQVNSGVYMELLDVLLINDVDVGWQAIEWLGAYGTIDNFRNGYKNDTFRIGLEHTGRPVECNDQCTDLSPSFPSTFPYNQRTAGPSNGGEGLYITNLFDQGVEIDSMTDPGTSKRCGSNLDDVVIEGTDYIFGPRPGWSAPGAHPFESRIPTASVAPTPESFFHGILPAFSGLEVVDGLEDPIPLDIQEIMV